MIKAVAGIGVFIALSAAHAAAEPYNFQGRNFCLTEDARAMHREGDPLAQPVSNPPKSFRLTYGPVQNKAFYAAEIEGADLGTMKGLYTSTEGQGQLFVAEKGVGFLWTIPSTGEVEILSLASGSMEEDPIWFVVQAQCYKADE